MQKHILAIGAHPGDMEMSCGAVLAAHRAVRNKVTIAYLITGSDQQAPLTAAYLRHQNKIAAEEAAAVINAQVITDLLGIPKMEDNKENRYILANFIRKLHPTSIITHWKKSIQPDHQLTHELVCDALTMSESAEIALRFPAYHGVNGLFFTENWEDKVDFEPFIYVDTTRYMNFWLKMVNCYQQFDNNAFYIDYYSALAKFRGSESHFNYACAFHTFSSKKQSLDIIP